MVSNAVIQSEGLITLSPNAVALTIGGSDPSGGAGIQADLKTFQQLGVFGMSAISLITVQNTQGVSRVELLPVDLIIEQIRSVSTDIEPLAVKTGALGSAEIVRAVAKEMAAVPVPVVVDPVLVSKHGQSLGGEDVVVAYRDELIGYATLVTPNRLEAERLSGLKIDSEEAGAKAIDRIRSYGAECVLIKMGEFDGKSLHMLNLGDKTISLTMPRLKANNTHGTGCILSAAITASFAKGTADVNEVVQFGLQEVFKAIQVNTELGKGIHPAEVRALGD